MPQNPASQVHALWGNVFMAKTVKDILPFKDLKNFCKELPNEQGLCGGSASSVPHNPYKIISFWVKHKERCKGVTV
jgi:hypothetical protein